MKARRWTSISSMPVFVLAWLIASGPALAKKPDGKLVFGSGEATAFNATQFDGDANLNIGDASFIVTLLAEPIQDPETGRIYFPKVEHVFDLGDGNTLTTIGEEWALPMNPPVFSLMGYMKIKRGTGRFAGARGLLLVGGELNMGMGTASINVSGVIYHLKDD